MGTHQEDKTDGDETSNAGMSKSMGLDGTSNTKMNQARNHQYKPVFEMVVLGSGGGPLETDTSGYVDLSNAVWVSDGWMQVFGQAVWG